MFWLYLIVIHILLWISMIRWLCGPSRSRESRAVTHEVGVGTATATSSSPRTKSKAAAGSPVKAESVKDTGQPKA